MASLEDENRRALARRFPTVRIKGLTMISLEWPRVRGVSGTSWVRDKSLFDLT
jgi:hypothetical protein